MSKDEYDRVAADQRRPLATSGRDDRELIRLATLAASSHNTQPWRFDVSPQAITIRPDRSRRCPVADPLDAHLFKSLGCAAENLVHAATEQGLEATPSFDEETFAVVVRLTETDDVEPSPLAAAIRTRQSTRGRYDGRPLEPDELAALQRAGDHAGACVVLLTSPERMEEVVAAVERGNRVQLTDRAFRRELIEWLRFNTSAALRTRDGLSGRSAGQPSVPTAVAVALQRVLVDAGRQARVDTERLFSSAGVAAFLTSSDDPAAWVGAGRAYQRFALQAEALDIRTAFVNQPLEVAELRPDLERQLASTGERVQLLVRFGHGERLPYSLRRRVEDVIDDPG